MNFLKEWVQRKSSDEVFSSMLVKLLSIRDIKTEKEISEFLYPSLKNITDPRNFVDIDKAVGRIINALDNNEYIGIFGDYDVDGICSTAILYEFLCEINANVIFTLPNRLIEGYGLSKAGVDRLYAKGALLIITVDCGTTAFLEIEYAKSRGIDVIVVDHHTPQERMPLSIALINPKRKDCHSKADYLCAAGVTFFLCIELRRRLRSENYFQNKKEPDLKKYLDLVALATVADVVPLFKDNRIFVKHGLLQIKKNVRLGLKSLFLTAKIAQEKITSTNLAFYVGPRINAAGRLENAEEALQLLISNDEKKCLNIASNLETINEERKNLEKNTTEEVIKAIDEEYLVHDFVLVVYRPHFHPGVVGIVASRIVELYHKPAIIIGEKGKGSGRSIPGFDLYEEVFKVKDVLKNFGGHAHAIGVTLLNDDVAKFRLALIDSVNKTIDQNIFLKKIFYDDVLSLKDVNLSLEEDIKKLEPFGAKNSHPVFRINNCFMRNLKRLNGGHLKGELEGNEGVISFIAFRMDIDDDLVDKPLDVLGIIEKNEWQGYTSLQLRLVDYRLSV